MRSDTCGAGSRQPRSVLGENLGATVDDSTPGHDGRGRCMRSVDGTAGVFRRGALYNGGVPAHTRLVDLPAIATAETLSGHPGIVDVWCFFYEAPTDSAL